MVIEKLVMESVYMNKLTKVKTVPQVDKITREKLAKYFTITREAIEKAIKARSKFHVEIREDFLDMIQRYYSDAVYFEGKSDMVNAFAALNYAHGWLDAGARIGVFVVKDSRLFAA